MCHFPSWWAGVGEDAGKLWFMTDQDAVKAGLGLWTDCGGDVVGHSACLQVFPEIVQYRVDAREGFPCPAKIAAAIRAGKMRRMMKVAGVSVVVNEAGELHDPDDGGPAERYFYRDGKVEYEGYWRSGKRCDPDDGSPAERWFYWDGQARYEAHYRNGRLHDPDDGGPAVRVFSVYGRVEYKEHWRDGGEYKVA